MRQEFREVYWTCWPCDYDLCPLTASQREKLKHFRRASWHSCALFGQDARLGLRSRTVGQTALAAFSMGQALTARGYPVWCSSEKASTHSRRRSLGKEQDLLICSGFGIFLASKLGDLCLGFPPVVLVA